MQACLAQTTVAMEPTKANINVDSLVFHDPTDIEMTPGKVAILSVLTTSNVFMLLGNGFSIYIIIRSRSLRQHTYYWLVLNLAVLDLMNSMFVVPINIVWEFHGYWPFSSVLCDLEIFCDLGFSIVAAYSTVLLALDKYLYITKPFFYHRFVGPRSTLASILLTWIVCMTYSAASVYGELARSTKEYKYNFPLDKCNFVLRHAYAITSFVLVFFIPLGLLLFTSSRILCVARQHIKKIHSNHPSISMATCSQDLSTLTAPVPANNASATNVSLSSRLSSPKHLLDRQQKSSITAHHMSFTAALSAFPTSPLREPKPASAFPSSPLAMPKPASALPTSPLADPKPASALPTSPLADPKPASAFPTSPQVVPKPASVHPTVSSPSGSPTSAVSTTHPPVSTGETQPSTASLSRAAPTNTDCEGCRHDGNPAHLPNTTQSQTAVNHRKENMGTANTGGRKRTGPVTSLRAFGTVTLVVVAYVVMFAPYWLASVVNLGCTCIAPLVFEDYLAVFYYMHSLVNPYIYMATDRRYKRAIRHLLARSPCCGRWWRRNSTAPSNNVSSHN